MGLSPSAQVHSSEFPGNPPIQGRNVNLRKVDIEFLFSVRSRYILSIYGRKF